VDALRRVNFDNIGTAFLTIFQVLTQSLELGRHDVIPGP
jgi:hypothetical protein